MMIECGQNHNQRESRFQSFKTFEPFKSLTEEDRIE
jgi:hypothetical protein